MTNEEIVALLRKDMEGEHQAIIQYLHHAYELGEGAEACEIEAVSRDEMRHFDWLADQITELGGDPTMEREPPDLSSAPGPEQMRKDVGLEQVAIDQYREHMELIGDPGIGRLIARILNDELRHQGIFVALAEELVAEAAPAVTTEAAPELAAEAVPAPVEGEQAAAPPVPQRAEQILNQGIRHEYTVILQYLYHSIVAEGKELAEEIERAAINEMQHMGWLSEALEGRGGKPDLNHTDLVLSRDPEKNLKADIAVEQLVTGAYTSQLSELQDPALQKLVRTIRDHEIYHDALFKDLLAEVEEEEHSEAQGPSEDDGPTPSASIPSVGSLIGE